MTELRTGRSPESGQYEPWFDDMVMKLMRAVSRRCGPHSRIAQLTDRLRRAVPKASPIGGGRSDE